jgi:hypothetical protein
MDCPICRDLQRACEAGLSAYCEARSAAIYEFSTRFAAYRYVEMERAKNDLEDHRLVCVAADRVIAFIPQREMSVSLSRVAA